MSKIAGKAASADVIEKIEYLVMRNIALFTRNSLSLIGDKEMADILIFKMQDPELQQKFRTLSACSQKGELILRLSFIATGIEDDHDLPIAIETSDLIAFSYQLIHDYLGRFGRPEAMYYASLAYNERCFVAKLLKEVPLLSWSSDVMLCCHGAARFLEIVGQNSREKRLEAYELYHHIVQERKSLNERNERVPFYVDLAFLKILIMGSESFEEVLVGLAKFKGQENLRYLLPVIEAEETWVRLCHKASLLRAEDDNPKLQKFLAYIKRKTSQEFLLLKEGVTEGEKKVLLSGSDEEKELFDLTSRYEALQNNPITSSKGVNMLSIDKSAELLKIIASDREYPERYLESLTKNDNEALFDFYTHYEDRISHATKEKYSGVNRSRYDDFVKKPEQYFLEAAALSGNDKAQYILFDQSLKEAERLIGEISKEKDRETKKILTKKLATAKGRWYKFLILSADNGNVDAKFQFANITELSRDQRNCHKANFFSCEEENIEYKYYIEAAALGHEGAKEKMREVNKKIKDICSNFREMTPENMRYLEAIAEYSEDHRARIAPVIAFCLLHGLGVEATEKKVLEANEEKALVIFESIYDTNKDARGSIAVYRYHRGDFSGFNRLLENVEYRQEALDILTVLIKERTDSTKKPEEALKIISKLKEFYKSLSKKDRSGFPEFNSFVYDRLEGLALRGFTEAKVEMAKDVIQEFAPLAKDEGFLRRQGALRILISSSDNGNYEVEITKQILSLLMSPEILPEDLSAAEIDRFFQSSFLAAQQGLASKLRFELAKSITKLAEKKGEQEKAAWDEKIMLLLRLSANSTSFVPSARECIVSHFIDDKYCANIEELKEIRKWYKSSGIEKSLAMAHRVYDVGCVVKEELERKKYVEEFIFYFDLAKPEEKELLRRECSDFAEIALEALAPKAEVVAVKSGSASGLVEAGESKAKDGGESQKTKPRNSGQKKRLGAHGKAESVAGGGSATAEPAKAAKTTGGKDGSKTGKVAKAEPKAGKAAAKAEKPETAAKKLPKAAGKESQEFPNPSNPPLQTGQLAPVQPIAASLGEGATDFDLAQKIAPSQKDGEEMKAFLAGKRIINSVNDLPKFLQEILHKLSRSEDLPESFSFLLKGSAVYSSHKCKRAPADLDCEFHIKGMDLWEKEKIVGFIAKNFNMDKSLVNIYEGGGTIFTVNAKDLARGIDLTFYSDTKQPPIDSRWTTSIESHIAFDKDGVAVITKSEGFLSYCSEKKLDLDLTNFFINPRSERLILRLCLLNTIEEVSALDLRKALFVIRPKSTIALFTLEVSNRGCAEPREKVVNFMKTHLIEGYLQNVFIANLLNIINLELPPLDNPEENEAPKGYYLSTELLQTVREAVQALAEEFPVTEIGAPSPKPALAQAGERAPLLAAREGRLGNQ